MDPGPPIEADELGGEGGPEFLFLVGDAGPDPTGSLPNIPPEPA